MGHKTVTVQRVEASSGLTNPEPPSMQASAPAAPATDQKAETIPPPIDYLDKMAQQYQIRATAIIDSDKPGRELMGEIELLDSSYHIKERFRVSEIQALGWTVTRTGYGLLLEKQSVAYVARSWPIDIRGRVDQRTVDSLGPERISRPVHPDSRPSSDIVIVGSGKPGHFW